MLKQSDNILHRLFSRQTCRAAPNTHIHRVRHLYKSIVPSHTVYDVDCPDHIFRKFTNDGQYLICFSRDYEKLIVYRCKWLSYCTKGSDSDVDEELPLKATKFESYFIELYTLCLGSATELICKDFFLSTENSCFGIFATTTGPDNDAPATPGALPGVPSIERITVRVVRLADGVVVDERVFHDDFIRLTHTAGIFMYDDLLAILSIRYQYIQILQVRETGMFVDIHTIGTSCREDDELVINSQAKEEILFQRQVAQKVKALPSEVGFSLPFNLHEPKGKALLSHSIGRGVNPVANVAYDDQTNIIRGDKSLGADIDIQYDGYFGGLFESLEMSGGSQNEAFVERCSAESLSELKSSFSPTRLETPSNCYANQGMAALSSDNQAESMPSATGNLGIAEPTGVSFPSSSTNMASTIGTESNFRDLSVFGESTSQGEPGGASASVHSSERNVMQYILSSRSLGSQQHHGSVEEVMPSGSFPVAFSSLAGYDRFVNLSAIQRQIGEASAFERLSSYVEAAEATPSAIGLESTHKGIILSDLGSTGSPHRTDDRANDMVTAAPMSTANATWQIDTPHSQQRSYHVWENVLNLPLREEHASERAFQELDGQGNQLLGGIKQRLLSFLFQSIWNQDVNPVIKTQQLKRFYHHFQHYAELVMWKVQFLDRYHLLVKFGSIDDVVSQNSDISHQTSFLAIYNMETTKILDFQKNSSKVLLRLFEHFCDHFRVLPRLPLLMNYITSHSNNAFSREQLQKQISAYAKSKSRSSAQVVKMTLASLPFTSQSQSPSVYFDQSLFHFDEKAISATDRHKPCMENAIKFMSRQKPNLLKFKINPGLELGSTDGVKRVASFLFHPILPFVISIQHSFMQQSIVNFHFRK